LAEVPFAAAENSMAAISMPYGTLHGGTRRFAMQGGKSYKEFKKQPKRTLEILCTFAVK